MSNKERIRRRAHEIWEREGQPDGRHEEHWARACQEIDAEEGESTDPARSDASATDTASSSSPAERTGRERSPPPDAAASEVARITD